MNNPEIELSSLNAAYNRLKTDHESLKMEVWDEQLKRKALGSSWEPRLNIAISAVSLYLAGNLVGSHLSFFAKNLIALFPSLLIGFFAILTIHIAVADILLHKFLSGASSTVEAARRIDAFELWKIRSTATMLAVGTVFWFGFPLFVAQLLGALDAVSWLQPGYAVANVVFGIAVVVGTCFASKNSRFSQASRSLISGEAIRAARLHIKERQNFLDEGAH